ncbi:MAG: four helix bundle protein, partial [Candidatus Marinimicrobia bacterium]|nr:four helix bundle protein [Candidatus Neomarinimicrobiota bacterium]
VFKITLSLPKAEDYGLTSQLRRSANSISGNIAEAFGRKTKKDKSNFYLISRGSAYETQSHLLYGQKVEYFDSAIVEDICNEYGKLIHELNKILKSFQSR